MMHPLVSSCTQRQDDYVCPAHRGNSRAYPLAGGITVQIKLAKLAFPSEPRAKANSIGSRRIERVNRLAEINFVLRVCLIREILCPG